MPTSTLVLGCRPSLPCVEDEVDAVASAAPNTELLLDPSPELVNAKAPRHNWCHFAGHADPKLGPDRVLVLCVAGGFAAVDASTLVDMLRSKKLVVLNGCKSVELGIKLRQAGVPNVVAWTTLLSDPAAKLFAVRFWQEMAAHTDDDEDALRTTVRKAFASAKLAVQSAVKPGGAVDVGGGKTHAASVPKYELHDPEDTATVVQTGPDRGTLLAAAGAEKAGRNAAGVPICLQKCALHDVPNLPEQYEPRQELEAAHRDALLRTTHTMAITATTTGVSGPAGAGKSTTAAVLARDPLVHAHFPDGVTWLSFGRERTGADVLRTLATSILRLDPTLPHEELPRAVSAALVGQRRLLVLDDIWTKEQLHAFSSLAAEGGLLGRLVTTRNNALAGEHAQTVDALQEEEGLRVLARYMRTTVEQLRADADALRLVGMCSGNPAMLRSVAALCKKKGAAHTLAYLEQCRQKMRHAKLPDAGEQYGTLFDALAGSLDHLKPKLAEQCAMLATFPEDRDVPWSVVGQLWGADELETEEALTELEEWHLIDVDWDKRTLSLIDLHLDYLRARAKDDLTRWHTALLHGCGRKTLGKDEGTADDAYWGDGGRGNVMHHLRGCGGESTALGGELTRLTLRVLALGAEDAKAIAKVLRDNSTLQSLDLASNNLAGETGYINKSEVQGSSFEVGAKVTYEGREMTVSQAPDSDGDIKLMDLSGVMALAASLPECGLTSLDVSSNYLGPEGGLALAEGLKGNTTLQKLDIAYNYIRAEGASALAAILKETQITTLFLRNNSLGPKGGAALAEGLKGNSMLQSLDLLNNNIGPEGASALAAVLKETRISKLKLDGNGIGPEGGAALAEGIKGNSALTSLSVDGHALQIDELKGTKPTEKIDLSHYGLAVPSAIIIASCIKVNGVLKELNLYGNTIGDKGASALAAILKETQITNLNIADNSIGDKGASALAAVLKETQIQKLDLRYNDLNDEAMKRAVKDAAGSGVDILF